MTCSTKTPDLRASAQLSPVTIEELQATIALNIFKNLLILTIQIDSM